MILICFLVGLLALLCMFLALMVACVAAGLKR